jgi:hypothetical protein
LAAVFQDSLKTRTEESGQIIEKTNARTSLKLFLGKNADAASNKSEAQAEVLDATVDAAEEGIQEDMDQERRTIQFAGNASQQS